MVHYLGRDERGMSSSGKGQGARRVCVYLMAQLLSRQASVTTQGRSMSVTEDTLREGGWINLTRWYRGPDHGVPSPFSGAMENSGEGTCG